MYTSIFNAVIILLFCCSSFVQQEVVAFLSSSTTATGKQKHHHQDSSSSIPRRRRIRSSSRFDITPMIPSRQTSSRGKYTENIVPSPGLYQSPSSADDDDGIGNSGPPDHDDDDGKTGIGNQKRRRKLILIRHGRTYMNDMINGTKYGCPGFTDVFMDENENRKYRDSPLTEIGMEEVKMLNEKIGNLINNKPGSQEELLLSEENSSFLDELQLVVCSPLTRTLQTLQYGLYDYIKKRNSDDDDNDDDDTNIPCIALPYASERVYLISDHGKPRSELKKKYNFVDFDTGFIDDDDDDIPWYYTPSEEDKLNYVEWRPHGEGQVYACLGESQHHFDKRMSDLYYWLNERDEDVICLICHHGVIKWLLSGNNHRRNSFENCELRVVDMESIQPEALIVQDSTLK